MGKKAEIQRQCGSLQVNIDKTMVELVSHPSYTVQQGVQKITEWFLSRNKSKWI